MRYQPLITKTTARTGASASQYHKERLAKAGAAATAPTASPAPAAAGRRILGRGAFPSPPFPDILLSGLRALGMGTASSSVLPKIMRATCLFATPHARLRRAFVRIVRARANPGDQRISDASGTPKASEPRSLPAAGSSRVRAGPRLLHAERPLLLQCRHLPRAPPRLLPGELQPGRDTCHMERARNASVCRCYQPS